MTTASGGWLKSSVRSPLSSSTVLRIFSWSGLSAWRGGLGAFSSAAAAASSSRLDFSAGRESSAAGADIDGASSRFRDRGLDGAGAVSPEPFFLAATSASSSLLVSESAAASLLPPEKLASAPRSARTASPPVPLRDSELAPASRSALRRRSCPFSSTTGGFTSGATSPAFSVGASRAAAALVLATSPASPLLWLRCGGAGRTLSGEAASAVRTSEGGSGAGGLLAARGLARRLAPQPPHWYTGNPAGSWSTLWHLGHRTCRTAAATAPMASEVAMTLIRQGPRTSRAIIEPENSALFALPKSSELTRLCRSSKSIGLPAVSRSCAAMDFLCFSSNAPIVGIRGFLHWSAAQTPRCIYVWILNWCAGNAGWQAAPVLWYYA